MNQKPKKILALIIVISFIIMAILFLITVLGLEKFLYMSAMILVCLIVLWAWNTLSR